MSYLYDKSSWFEFRLPSYRDVDKSTIGTVYVGFCIDMNRETLKTECTKIETCDSRYSMLMEVEEI